MLEVTYAPEPGSVESLAEITSLVLIVASFLIITYVAFTSYSSFKSRRKSFSFEMFVFTVVLVAAEIPRTLYSLGVVNLDALAPTGLGIHSISMVFLTLFVAYRAYGFYGGKAMVIVPGDANGLILRSAEESLSKTLGETTTKALSFYFDPRLMLIDPVRYDSSLRGVFGEGADVIERLLIDSVCEATGIDRTTVQRLDQAISRAKQMLGEGLR
jgi:hypothetical protein